MNSSWRLRDNTRQHTIEDVVVGNLARAVAQVMPNIDSSRALLDVGANVGEISALLAEVFPNGKVYAFEAQSLVYTKLCERISTLNSTGRLIPVLHAVSNVAGQVVTMYAPHNKTTLSNFTGSGLVGRQRGVSVAVNNATTIRLDTWCADHGVDPFFAKIDTEGFDVFVVEGMERLLRKKRVAAFVFEYNWGLWRLALRKFGSQLELATKIRHSGGVGLFDSLGYLEKYGYAAYALTPTKLMKLSSCWRNDYLRWHFTANVVAVRKDIRAQ